VPFANEIIPYLEMCQRESMSLQRGMNFYSGRGYSVILMSVRPNAPYRDRFQDDGTTLIYEGHDASRTESVLKMFICYARATTYRRAPRSF